MPDPSAALPVADPATTITVPQLLAPLGEEPRGQPLNGAPQAPTVLEAHSDDVPSRDRGEGTGSGDRSAGPSVPAPEAARPEVAASVAKPPPAAFAHTLSGATAAPDPAPTPKAVWIVSVPAPAKAPMAHWNPTMTLQEEHAWWYANGRGNLAPPPWHAFNPLGKWPPPPLVKPKPHHMVRDIDRGVEDTWAPGPRGASPASSKEGCKPAPPAGTQPT